VVYLPKFATLLNKKYILEQKCQYHFKVPKNLFSSSINSDILLILNTVGFFLCMIPLQLHQYKSFPEKVKQKRVAWYRNIFKTLLKNKHFASFHGLIVLIFFLIFCTTCEYFVFYSFLFNFFYIK
jgi:hypothetical protein